MFQREMMLIEVASEPADIERWPVSAFDDLIPTSPHPEFEVDPVWKDFLAGVTRDYFLPY